MFSLPGCPRDKLCFMSGPKQHQCCVLSMEAASEECSNRALMDLVAQEREAADSTLDVQAVETNAQNVRRHAPLQLSGCQHVCSPVKLLFLLALRGFRCPVCRQGSGDQVDISCTVAPPEIQPELWTSVCALATAARKRVHVEEEEEEEREVMRLFLEQTSLIHQLSSSELVQRCAFDLTIACYMTQLTTARNYPSIPRASVTVQIRPGSMVSSFDADGWLLLRTAHGRHRTISANVNRAKWYTARVDIQLLEFEDTLFPVLVGHQLACPKSEGRGSARRAKTHAFSDAERNSELSIEYESCSYTGEYMIKGITFRMHEADFRRHVLHALEQALCE